MTTARAKTRQRRAKIEGRTNGEIRDALPLEHQVALHVCGAFYHECACDKALDKPCCDRMSGAARAIIDTVRRFDRRKA